MEIDNRSIRLGDELKKEIKPGSKVKIAAATFSMFAFQQLKEELETIEELKFIFTNPTFVTDETRVGYREYTIPKKEREQSIFGGRYELKLMNELTQKAIARECADWIRKKARFKSINIETDEMPNGMRIETDDDTVAVDRLKNFDRKELGYDSSLFKTTRHIYHAPLSLSYLDEFDSFWQDDEYFRDVTEELLVHYKETLTKEKDGKHFKIVRRFRTQEDYQIQFDGDNLDQVYEMLIKKMGKDQFQSKLDGNLKESVELTEQLEKLEKQAQRLKKQMYAEKSMRKQMEVKKGYQEVLKQIQELK
jgi:helicase